MNLLHTVVFVIHDFIPRETALTRSPTMSDLYRSAIGARLAKLPPDVPTTRYPGLEIDPDDEEDDGDSIGDLPGSGLGPPAMQVMPT